MVCVVVSVVTSVSKVNSNSSVVVSAVVGSLSSVVTFCVAPIICTGETVLSISFSLAAAVEDSTTTVVVVAFAVLGTSTFVESFVRRSVETGSVSLAAVVTGSSIVISVVTSNASAAVLPASVATDDVDASEVSSPGATVVSGVVISVADSVDSSLLASVLTVKGSIVTFVSTVTFSENDVAATVGAAVLVFVVSTTCFSVVVWAMVGSLISLVTFFVALVVCTGETILIVLPSVETAFLPLTAVVIRASVVISVVTSTAAAVVIASVTKDVVNASLVATTD